MNISACVITKNASDCLARCLGSVAHIVAECVVVDTGSTDNTIDIAKRLGAKVYHYAWDNNFANAKNYCLSKARGKWVIFLDADEYLDSNTAKVLPKVINKVDSLSQYDAILANMINLDGFGGRELSKNPTTRIFRNKKQIRFAGAIHEGLKKSGGPLNWVRLDDIDLIIFHTGYSLDVLPDKFKRNLELLLYQLDSGKADFMTYYYLSNTYSNLQNHKKTIEFGKLALENSKIIKSPVAIKAYVFLISSMLELIGEYDYGDIQEIIRQAEEVDPNHPEILYWKGVYHKKQGDNDSALICFEAAIEKSMQYRGLLINEFPLNLDRALQYIGAIYFQKNELLKALDYFFKSLSVNKFNSEAFKDLIQIIKDQTLNETVVFLNHLYDYTKVNELEFIINQLNNMNCPELILFYRSKVNKVNFS